MACALKTRNKKQHPKCHNENFSTSHNEIHDLPKKFVILKTCFLARITTRLKKLK